MVELTVVLSSAEVVFFKFCYRNKIKIHDLKINNTNSVQNIMCTMCPPTRASWRHLAYMTEIVFPSAHPSPQHKRQIDRFSHFCTAPGRVSSGMPGHVFSHNNCPFQWGIWAPSIHASLHPPESITQMVSRSVQPFL